MRNYFLITLALLLLLTGCKKEPAVPATDPTTVTAVQTEAATVSIPDETEPRESTAAETVFHNVPYTVAISKCDLPIYSGPGYDYFSTCTIENKGIYTIVEETEDFEGNLWGRLKSGIGWVDLTRIRSEEFENALMSANYADENLVLHGTYHHYSTNREFRTPIAFRAYGTLRNVALFEIGLGDGGLFRGADLYILPEMTEEMPLVAELDFPGDMSTYGIRFEDEAGVTHTYHIYISLRNGDLMFEKAE